MKRIKASLLAACFAIPALADEPDVRPELTAAQIVEKNMAARGGLDAWREIETMVWLGHVESASASSTPLPFALEMKRPNKTRFEIQVQNQKSVRMFDGIRGWKLRTTRSGNPDLEPFTAEELRFARDGQGIDGPLIDYQTKGVAVALEGVDQVEGNRAYRLNVKLPSGASHHVWIDAKSFLDVKSDRVARNAFGMSGTVSVYYRDYREVEGLKLPFLIESGGDSGKTTDKMTIDRVVLNPPLEDWMFARPHVPKSHNAVTTISASAPQSRRDWPGSPVSPGPYGPNPGSVPGSGNAE